jgi:hypothetical protein
MASKTKNHSAEAWTKADRFFLADALVRGMSVAEVAAFLGRTEDEVRERLRLSSHTMCRARDGLGSKKIRGA